MAESPPRLAAIPLAFNRLIELGSAMLADWGIPGVFAKPMALYEGPNHSGNIQDSRTNSLIMMLRLSHWLADLALCDADQRPQLTPAWLTQAAKLDIPAEDAVNLIDDVIAEWHDWGTLLQIHTEPLPSFAEYAQENESIAKEASSLRIVVADSNEFTRRKTMALLAEDGNHTVYAVNDGMPPWRWAGAGSDAARHHRPLQPQADGRPGPVPDTAPNR